MAMTIDEKAWIAYQYDYAKHKQKIIAYAIGRSSSSVCQAINSFCRHYNVDLVSYRYEDHRRKIVLATLVAHMEMGGKLTKPTHPTKIYCPRTEPIDAFGPTDHQYVLARREHVFLLRCEGCNFGEIARAIGVSNARARQIFNSFIVRLRWAMRGTVFSIQTTATS